MKKFAFIQQLGFWVFWVLAIVVLTVSELTYQQMMMRVLLIGSIFAVNFYTFYWLLTPQYFEQKKYSQFIFYSLFFQAILFLARYYIEVAVLQHYTHFKMVDSLTKGMVLMLVSNVTVSSYSVMLRLSLSRMDYETKYLTKEKEQMSMELQFLKSQIHPHFLFNTLNNLYTLIRLKSDKAGEALLQLSEVLRYLLYDCEAPNVLLSKEITVLLSFVKLHQLKYEEPIPFTIDTQGINAKILIQPMLLIPLLENAFKYSDVGVNKAAYIRIELKNDAKFLYLNMKNSIDPSLPITHEQGGIGLKNVSRRIALAYGTGYEPIIYKRQTSFEISINMPVHEA